MRYALLIELSSLRSQLEYCNDGIMGEGGQDHKVKEEKRDNCLLAKLLLTGKLVNDKLFLRTNIPIFHQSLAQTWHAGPAFHGHHFGNPTATEKFSTQLAPGQAIIPSARQGL